MSNVIKNNINVIRQILSLPKVDINLHCENTECENIYNHFVKRHPKFKIIKNKTIGVELISLFKFKTYNDYLASVSGKNSASYFSRKASKNGYSVSTINPHEFLTEIYEINTSTDVRQGKKMDNSYSNNNIQYQINNFNTYFGIFKNDKLTGYLWLYNYGEVAIIARILGHNNFLKDGIMYLLMTESINYYIENKKDVKYLMYDTFFGASEGLKLFKKRIGFVPHKVNWILK